jgi:galactokinase
MPAIPPKMSTTDFNATEKKLVDAAKQLYQDRLAYFAQTHQPPAYVCSAPGRVNLIGEHVDYQDGFVLPLCLDPAVHATVVYGTGFLTLSKSSAATTLRLRLVSDQAFPGEEGDVMIEERRLSANTVVAPKKDDDRSPTSKWVNYVVGVIVQYLPDIPSTGGVLDLAMAYVSSVPISAGLSSSAALEVVTAKFLECFLHDGMAYSSVPATVKEGEDPVEDGATRALRCQKAENEWAHSPCGIMDQMVVSCGIANHLMLLDCRTLKYTQVPMKQGEDAPVFLITNSKVTHDIANENEYGARRKECSDAVAALQSVPLYHVEALRDATLADVELGKERGKLDEIMYKRAHHVVSENTRTKECCAALRLGLWDKVGALMNASHASLRDDFAVSCKEVDILVDIAQGQPGVYGSRITGGGFGGCTVTLVQPSNVHAVMEAIQTSYKAQTGIDCECFVTAHPGNGARVLAIDMDCKPESDFYKMKK